MMRASKWNVAEKPEPTIPVRTVFFFMASRSVFADGGPGEPAITLLCEAWAALDPVGALDRTSTWPAAAPGEWTAKVLVNGVVLVEVRFTIVDASGGGGGPRPVVAQGSIVSAAEKMRADGFVFVDGEWIAGGFAAKKQAPKQLLPIPKVGVGENAGKPVKKYHGRSWLPILEQESADGWDQANSSHTFHEIQMYYPMRVVREGKYKLIWNIAWRLEYPFASDLWAASTWQSVYRNDGKYFGKRFVCPVRSGRNNIVESNPFIGRQRGHGRP